MSRIVDEPVDPDRPCRSTGPAGERCVRPRGHRESDDSRDPMKLHRDADDVVWAGGVRTMAHYPRGRREYDDHYSEADYQSWMRV